MPVDGSAYAGILTRYIDSDAFEAGGKNCFHDAGPHYYGQRYTPKGGARGIYMAEDVPTALGEVRQNGLAALCP
ncbi:MAG: RES domain-containing protein, partial [Opitutales bacterium]